MTKPRTPHRPAAVLVLAMLLMSAIVGSSIALSVVISDSGRQSSTLNNYIAASLAADSGLERGLAVVKAGRVNQLKAATSSAAGTTVATALENFTVAASSPSANKLSWSKLLPRESVTFDYFKGADLTDAEKTFNFQGTSGSGKLDISWIGLDGDNVPLFTGRNFLSHDLLTSANPNSGNVNLVDAINKLYKIDGTPISTNVEINSVHGFRINLTAMQDNPDDAVDETIYNLTVAGINADTSPAFPSRISITSTGTAKTSQATKTVSVPWQLPTSPVFNYVVFTEGPIIPETPS